MLQIEPVALVVGIARARGCTCDVPGVRFTGPLRRGETTCVLLEHDDHCPLAPTTSTAP
jgi:hypothetical protein